MKNTPRTVQRRKTVDPRADKARDISRSVLPSTARRSARKELTSIRRRTRRAAAVAARSAVAGCVCEEAAVCPQCDPWTPSLSGRVRDAVVDRRAADKLGPLLRWGQATVDRVGSTDPVVLRAVLPVGLIGSHAAGHLESAGVIDSGRFIPRVYGGVRTPVPMFEALCSVAMFALEVGDVKALNAALSKPPLSMTVFLSDRRWGPVVGEHLAGRGTGLWSVRDRWSGWFTVSRLLRGVHDVEAWAADVRSLRVDHAALFVWAVGRGWRNTFGERLVEPSYSYVRRRPIKAASPS
jgi:hypothetical protein